MPTFTASEINPLKTNHTGINVVRSYFEGSVTVSEVILLARVPNHATILDWRLCGGTLVDGATGTWKVGFFPAVVNQFGASLSEAGLHAGASLTVSGLAGGGIVSSRWSVSASIMVEVMTRPEALPIDISLSDDRAYTWIGATLSSASGTATTTMQFTVWYTLE